MERAAGRIDLILPAWGAVQQAYLSVSCAWGGKIAMSNMAMISPKAVRARVGIVM